ncbi:MAG: hypothetical protein GC171_12125 [Terrimonas sp.]|nr:hypothetical protein [Terrimonas sp.]
MIKYILASGLFLITLAPHLFAQTCSDADVIAIKTKWVFDKDAYNRFQPGITATLLKNVFENTAAYKQLFIAAYPEPSGGLMKGYAYIVDQTNYHIRGHADYVYNATYFGYRCAKDKNEVIIDPEKLSINMAELRANNLRGVLEEVADSFELNGKPVRVFRLAHALKDPRGFHSFEGLGHDNSIAVLFTHNDILPYRYLTRKEYLSMIKTYWEKLMKNGMALVDEQEKQILDMEASAKKDYTGELRENMLKELNSQLEQYRKRKGANKQHLDSGIQQELDSIDYAFKHYSDKELREPAIPKADDVYRGFITEKEGGFYFVILDSSYFKKNLPSYAAQTLVLQSYYLETEPGALSWVKAIREKFPYDKLKTLIDK